MNKFFTWAKGFLSENGEASSKRFVGVVSAIALCWTLYANHDAINEPSEALVYSVAALSAAALGITAAEKIFKKPSNE
jgi:uncharacterized membrane protein